MALALVRFLWRLPKAHPTASTMISGTTGLLSIISSILLIASFTNSYGGNQSSGIAGGVILLLTGLLVAALAIYAAYSTDHFRQWSRADGTYGHTFIRWLGPICIIVAILELIIGLWIITIVSEGMSDK